MDTAKNPVLFIHEATAEREHFVRALSDSGTEVVIANDLKEAGEKLKRQNFFCIVIDLELKSGSAMSLIRLIRTRADLKNADTPIVILHSGLSKEAVRDLFGKIQGAFAKPVEVAMLTSHIAKIAKFVKMSE